MSETTTHPTWGYRPDGSAAIFDLGSGEDLPEGWYPSPNVITDPARATAEALSAAVTRATETPRRPATIPTPSSVDADTIAALRAENAHLAAEVIDLRKALADSQAGHAGALAHVETLATQLAEALAEKAPAEPVQAGGGASVPEPPTAEAPPPRTRDEAREEVRALLGKELTDREIARQVGVSPSTVAAVRKAAEA